MLHEFVTANREELIRRCRSKVSRRASPPVTLTELEHGVPLFLEGALLEDSLTKLRDLMDRSLPPQP